MNRIRKPLTKAVGDSDGRVRRLLDSLARAYEQTNQVPEAIEATQDLLSTLPEEKFNSPHGLSLRATVVRLLLKNGQSERAEELATELYNSISDLEDTPGYPNTLVNLTLGLAKTGNSKLDEAGEHLEYVLSRKHSLQQFSKDETVVLKRLLELLVENLDDVDSELQLFDAEEWNSVLDSIEFNEADETQ